MADFLGSEKEEETEVDDSPQTIKVGEEEYTQEELDSLVGLGKMAREIEEKQNTKLDRVFPEFTKKSQQVKELEGKLEELEEKAKLETPVPVTPGQVPTVEEKVAREQALAAAKELGILTKGDLEEMGYVKKDDLNPALREITSGDKLAEQAISLQKTIDGEDGRPKFIAEDVLNFMGETNISDMEMAYEILHKGVIDEWKVDRAIELREKKKGGFETIDESAAGAPKAPPEMKVTKDNFEEMVARGVQGEFTE